MELSTLHSDYAQILEAMKAKRRQRFDHVFVMAIDAEWYDAGGRNVVLSYQIATTSAMGTRNIIEYMRAGERLSLVDIVEMGIRSVAADEEIEQLKRKKIRVILVSHNIAAEWSVLADRDEPYITKRLALIRRSPITDGHSIKFVIRQALTINLEIFDTMLLAPASHQSLKKLSVLLGSKSYEKESITQHYIERMDQYLRDLPDQFEKYALKDSEITLRLFFLLQKALNELVGGDFKLYRTLASAAVKSFTAKNEWYEAYRNTLHGPKFYQAYQLIKRSYHGGRNEGYFLGRTSRYPETRDKIWVDVDFSGCYPTAMALCPKIDTEAEIDHIPLRYQIDDQLIAKLKKENVPPDIIGQAKAALEKSTVAFDRFLMGLKPKALAWKIRSAARVVDNRLIDKWYTAWREAKKAHDDAVEKILIPGFARVRFKFPQETQYPCLPIKHEKYGLLYVLEGETTAPASEIILAIEAGATVEALTSIELPVEKDENGQPVRFTLNHLSVLAKDRSAYKKEKDNPEAQVFEKLLKEFTNSLYGKFSQAVNTRNVYRPATGEMLDLRESTITEPCTAALVTSLARAALSAALLGIYRFNRGRDLRDQVTVISATTDGLLIGLPAPEGFTVVDDYYDRHAEGPPKLKGAVEQQLSSILERFGCSGIIGEIDTFLPIKQMRRSRLELTGSREILEIKHLADEVVSIKTRGQIGLLSTGHASILAKFGHKPPLSEIIEDPEQYKRVMEAGGTVRNTEDANWIMGHIERIENGLEHIEDYTFITLTSFRKMTLSNGALDLVKSISRRKINTNFDWKRKVLLSGTTDPVSALPISPFTVPHRNTQEMLQYRNHMEAIRRTGHVASPEKVLQRVAVKGRSVRLRGGAPVTVTRLFLRGIVQNKIPICKEMPIYSEGADLLNAIWENSGFTKSYPKPWKADDLKNAKRGAWEAGSILSNAMLERLVEDLSSAFDADIEAAKSIFSLENFEETNVGRVEQVITAIMSAPAMGLEPFISLYQAGRLPGKQKLLDHFGPQLPEEVIETFCGRQFIPGQLHAAEFKKLKALFYRLGIPSSDAQACAKCCINPPGPVPKKQHRNPGVKRCTDHFVLALLQSDIGNCQMRPTEVIDRLKPYSLTKNRYYKLKYGRFSPNSITDTQNNRRQICRMSKACGIDSRPLLDALLEKR